MHAPSFLAVTAGALLATALAEGSTPNAQIATDEVSSLQLTGNIVDDMCSQCAPTADGQNIVVQQFNCLYLSQHMCGLPDDEYGELPFCDDCGVDLIGTPYIPGSELLTACSNAAQDYLGSSGMCEGNSGEDGPTIGSSYEWVIKNPSECSSSKCGYGGTYTVEVACAHPDNHDDVVTESNCNLDTKPLTQYECNIGPCEPGFTSSPGPWTSCSKTCGDGFQTRERRCVNEAGEYVAGSNCNRMEYLKPEGGVNQLCNLGECGDEEYYLEYDRWEECSQDCTEGGVVGTTTRTAKCFKMSGGEAPTSSIGLEECEKNGVRAELTKPCNIFSPRGDNDNEEEVSSSNSIDEEEGPPPTGGPYTYRWVVQNPSECTAPRCGYRGTYAVDVVCARLDGSNENDHTEVADESLCDPDTKPDTMHECNIGPCEPGFTSSPGPWTSCSKTCGDGFQTRERRCVNEAGEYVSSSNCNRREYFMPEGGVNQLCNLGECGDEEYYLEYGRWEECSQDCTEGGVVGTTTRTAKCFKMIGGETPTSSIGLEECEKNGVRAKLIQPCNTFSSCSARMQGNANEDETLPSNAVGSTLIAACVCAAAVALVVAGVTFKKYQVKREADRVKMMEKEAGDKGLWIFPN